MAVVFSARIDEPVRNTTPSVPAVNQGRIGLISLEWQSRLQVTTVYLRPCGIGRRSRPPPRQLDKATSIDSGQSAADMNSGTFPRLFIPGRLISISFTVPFSPQCHCIGVVSFPPPLANVLEDGSVTLFQSSFYVQYNSERRD